MKESHKRSRNPKYRDKNWKEYEQSLRNKRREPGYYQQSTVGNTVLSIQNNDWKGVTGENRRRQRSGRKDCGYDSQSIY